MTLEIFKEATRAYRAAGYPSTGQQLRKPLNLSKRSTWNSNAEKPGVGRPDKMCRLSLTVLDRPLRRP
jgi:hypothetical protein